MDYQKFLNRVYKHSAWFIGGQKTNREAIEYFVDTGDFVLEITRKYKKSYNGEYGFIVKSSQVIEHLIRDERFDCLQISYTGKEGGKDRGYHKVRYFVEYKNSK